MKLKADNTCRVLYNQLAGSLFFVVHFHIRCPHCEIVWLVPDEPYRMERERAEGVGLCCVN